MIKTSFFMFLEEAFPRPRYWKQQLLLVHGLVSLAVLCLMRQIFLTMLVSEHPWKALLGSVLILLGLLYILSPLLKEVLVIALDYVEYRNDLAFGLAIARARLMDPLINDTIRALKDRKDPRIQLIKFIQLAAIANYPLEELMRDFAMVGMLDGVKLPEFVADRVWNPSQIECGYYLKDSAVRETIIVYIDRSHQS